MIKVRQAIVVEGRYDKNMLRQVVDAAIFETNGFAVMHDQALVGLLRKAAQTTGLVILTDSDGAGFVIRSYLRGVLPAEGVLHAYIPDIPGKERRKRTPGKEGKLGVEGMRPEVLVDALRTSGAELDGVSVRSAAEPITKLDLYRAGLTGGVGSREKRLALLRELELPAHMSTNALLQALNLLFTRETFLARIQQQEEPS